MPLLARHVSGPLRRDQYYKHVKNNQRAYFSIVFSHVFDPPIIPITSGLKGQVRVVFTKRRSVYGLCDDLAVLNQRSKNRVVVRTGEEPK